ncbi:GerAB/ArcD/ProY family transporter [Paenibacillus methanolicus]|uniref:Spore germination protein KB n=1 Tax=Paenibacillus methanolicus TaxID=582686 RepID=A0A5S5CKH7_9BACL|nr:endospore germination permease [Paenibacillus methanolicus]TYP79061.1 spore germination protein KB [Paenibacillus methanolicus]
MLDNGKITVMQMSLFFYISLLTTAVLTAQSLAAQMSKQDMWLAPYLGAVTGGIVVVLICALHRRFPGQSIIEYSVTILGRPLGKLLGLFLMFFTLQATGIVLRQFVEFIALNFLPRTPIFAVAAAMVFVCGVAVRSGVETLARHAQLLAAVILLFFFLISVPLFPDFKYSNILPVFGNGLIPIIKGGLVYHLWFTMFIYASFYMPSLKNDKKLRRTMLGAVGMLAVTMSISNLATLFIVGNMTPFFMFPFMVLGRYISLADFFEHLESLVMAFWIFSLFLRIVLTYYAMAIGTAQWLKLSDYKPIVFPIGGLIIIFSLWTRSFAELLFQAANHAFYYTSVGVGIPLLLLAVAMIRQRRGI